MRLARDIGFFHLLGGSRSHHLDKKIRVKKWRPFNALIEVRAGERTALFSRKLFMRRKLRANMSATNVGAIARTSKHKFACRLNDQQETEEVQLCRSAQSNEKTLTQTTCFMTTLVSIVSV